MTDHTTHDLALARAERDAWQTTCEELHRTIAGRDVEIEAHLGRCEAADQRARSFEAALAHEREASKGLVAQVEAQVEALRKDLAHAQERLAERRTAQRGEVERLEAERDRLRAELAELRARPVLTVDLLRGALDAHGHAALARKLFAHLGPAPLPSPDRAEELCRAYHERAADMDGHMVGRWQYHGPESQAICTEAMRRALASLGAPPTSPPAAIDADALYARCENDFMGGYTGQLYDAFKHGMWTVCNVLRSTKPTSPPAARPVFAGVSEEELALEYARAVDRIPGIRAVLARLEVSLVAPVDPEVVARRISYNGDPLPEHVAVTRRALVAEGVPVTPEAGK